MAYIRTFDGEIYDVGNDARVLVKEEFPSTVYWDFNEHNGQPKCRLFIQKSDNPEELCDEFVIEKPLFGTSMHYHYLVYSYDNWKHYVLSGDSEEIEVPYDGQPLKGAIWTDKGLKYVIERTKDGKWELL